MRAAQASPDVAVHETLADAAAAAAREIAAAAGDAASRRGRFVVALAGGETPRFLYTILAQEYRASLPWARTELCFGDERCVGPDDPASNYGMVESTLLAHAPIARHQVHRIPGELGPNDAAAYYDARLRQLFAEDPGAPTFDVALLGVGTDGHTASLFPADPGLEARTRWATAALAPPGMEVRDRVTVTLPVLNRARLVLFLCAGAAKRDVVRRILGGTAPELPAARVHGMERTAWILDRAAAG